MLVIIIYPRTLQINRMDLAVKRSRPGISLFDFDILSRALTSVVRAGASLAPAHQDLITDRQFLLDFIVTKMVTSRIDLATIENQK
ncbi:hypothetical protein EOB80_16905 [Mesorhizobium sp. M7A.F.Ca.MR.245.00.0.0]|nr:hypothetical protein EOB80_16905 [Mesorhizobium sp. M7A.F.Ca.MR.245.00.0.0]